MGRSSGVKKVDTKAPVDEEVIEILDEEFIEIVDTDDSGGGGGAAAVTEAAGAVKSRKRGAADKSRHKADADASTSNAEIFEEEEEGEEEPELQDTPATGSRKKRRKKKKVKKTEPDAEAEGTTGAAGATAAAAAATPGLDSEAEGNLQRDKDRAAAGPAEAVTLVGVTLVRDGKEIARDVEMSRLIRQPRYFDDAPMEQTNSGRCFNCGKAGHRVTACTFATRQKPCFLCCQFGHEARGCPAELCFTCGRPAHKARDCPNQVTAASWEMGYGRCLRCASPSCSCADKADYFRYDGGCSESYLEADLSKCQCYVCGSFGHVCCKKAPSLPARVTCYSCGSSSHLGEACPRESRPHLAAERTGDMRAAQREREADFQRATAAAAARVVGRTGHQRDGGFRPRYSDQYDSRKQYDGTASQKFGSAGKPYGRQGSKGFSRHDSADYPGSVDRDSKRQKQLGEAPVWAGLSSNTPQRSGDADRHRHDQGRQPGSSSHGKHQSSSHGKRLKPSHGKQQSGSHGKQDRQAREDPPFPRGSGGVFKTPKQAWPSSPPRGGSSTPKEGRDKSNPYAVAPRTR